MFKEQTKEEQLLKIQMDSAEGLASLQKLTATLQHNVACKNWIVVTHLTKKIETAVRAVKEEAIEMIVQQIEKGEVK